MRKKRARFSKEGGTREQRKRVRTCTKRNEIQMGDLGGGDMTKFGGKGKKLTITGSCLLLEWG